MNRLRLLFVTAAAVIFVAIFAEPVLATLESQRAQIGITIIVNVSPSPIAYAPRQVPGGSPGMIVAAMSMHPAPAALQHVFRANSLHFIGPSRMIAQAQVQHGVLVQAEVTPNPNATLLYSNLNEVTINNVSPGGRETITCAFTVTVDHSGSWSLDEGLSNDFASEWTGTDLANNTYKSPSPPSTPQPTSTPYVVYPDDGSKWSLAATGSTIMTYCVDLTITVPASVPVGSYSTNAIYTLFF